jgi:ribosome-associated protein
MNLETMRPEVRFAVEAAHDKQALDVTVLNLAGLGAFSEYFVLCSGSSGPQMHAIADEIEDQLMCKGVRPQHREGRGDAEWMLLDYGGFVVHIFNVRARAFYDLERLWRTAERLDVPPTGGPEPPRAER